MANRLSSLMSNVLNSTSWAPNDPHYSHGRQRVKTATVGVLAADNDGIIFPLIRIKASDILLGFNRYCDAITGGTDYDLGFYAGNAAGTISAGDWNVADQTLITSARDVLMDGQTFATQIKTEIGSFIFGSGTNGILPSKFGRPCWEMAGLASAPPSGVEWDICLTANTVGTAAGNIIFIFRYLSGD